MSYSNGNSFNNGNSMDLAAETGDGSRPVSWWFTFPADPRWQI